jgi:hypothetical protein
MPQPPIPALPPIAYLYAMPKPLVFFLALFCLVQSLFAQELIPYRNVQLWGFADTNGKVLAAACRFAMIGLSAQIFIWSTKLPTTTKLFSNYETQPNTNVLFAALLVVCLYNFAIISLGVL